MSPKIKRVTADIERRLAIGCIVSDAFLRDIHPILDEQLLLVPYIRTLATWCKEYWDNYSRAPMEEIRNILRSKVRTGGVMESEQELIDEFLSELKWKRESTKFNADYWLDESENYLDTRRLQMISEDTTAHLTNKDLDRARELVLSYTQVRRPTSQAFDPFTNREMISKVFEERAEPLFTIPGALGVLLNPLFHRKALIGVLAPEKRGKTFKLTELGLHASRAGCNVAFFAVGDMTEEEMTERLHMRITGKTTREWDCGMKMIPVLDCWWNQIQSCSLDDCENEIPCMEKKDNKWIAIDFEHEDLVGYKPCTACQEHPKRSRQRKWRGAHWWEPIRIRMMKKIDAVRAGRKFVARHGDRWRQFVYEDGGLTTRGIQSDLEQMRDKDGWVPDVVIVDYADLMGPEDPRITEERHKHNATWRGLNTLRKRWSVCLIAATQANRAGHEENQDLNLMHQSEDKRKAGHVTAMLGINQNAQEEKEGNVRIAILAARGSGAKSRGQVRVLRCLEMGRPLIGSYFV